MAVRLSKGQKVDLTKTHPGLRKIVVGLGWNAGGLSIDLDASVFLLGSSGKVQSDSDFIFYNNPLGANGAVRHSGDKRQGIGSGDDEQVFIDLHSVPQHIDKIAFTITIHEADQRRQSFGQVAQAYVRIFNEDNGEELLRYDLGKDFSIETAIVTAELYRYQGEWKFNAVGSGFQGGLGALCRNYGLEVDESPAQASASTSWQQPFQRRDEPNQPSQPNQPFSSGWQTPGVQDWTNSQAPQNYNTPFGGSPSAAAPGGNMYSGDMARCPRCGSTQIISGKKGFGFGKAAIGGLIFGPIGLLGGFLGSKKLEFTCARCGNKWSTEAADYMKWMNTQKERARELINRYKGQDMLDAVVAGCALVAAADGVISQIEKQKMVEVIQQVEELRAFDMTKVIDRFNHFTSNFQSDPMLAKAEAMRAVGKLKGKPDAARLVVRLCCAIGMADGSFDPQEKQIVSEICRELHLNPAEFIE